VNEQVEKLLSDVSVETLTLVAREEIADIDTPHNADRTIGIVKVSGTAVSVRHGSHDNWSSVMKIIDQSIPTNDAPNWGVLRTR